MVRQRGAYAAGFTFLLAMSVAGCGNAPSRGEESYAGPAPNAIRAAIGARESTAEARLDEIIRRTRMARDDGTMAALTPPGGSPPSRFVPVLDAGDIERLDTVHGGLAPVLRIDPRTARARVTLPTSAAGAFRVEETATGRAIAIHLEGASGAGVELARGLAIFRGGAPEGGDLIARPNGDGLEDYVAFEKRPSAERLVYHVDVSRFAGLRLFDRVLELLDEKGVPRMRMARPYVADANGKRVEASVSVSGCAYDADPIAPYDRPVTPPGARSCAITIAWSGAAYPALVDPTWNQTALNLTAARTNHTAILLLAQTYANMVLIAGGTNGTSVLASAEVWNPANATSSPIVAMSTPRVSHATGWRSVTGGLNAASAPLASIEWLKIDGTVWVTSAASMSAPRANHAMAGFTATGEFLIVGGSTADRWTTVNGGTITPADPPSEDKRYHLGLQIASNQVWMVGGYRWNGANVYQTSVDVYDQTGKRTQTITMPHEHAQGGVALLNGGSVLVHTGLGNGAFFADVYSGGAWTSTSRPWRRDHVAVALPDGTALIAGHDAPSERYDPVSKAFLGAGDNVNARENLTGTLLPDGRVMISGGHAPGVAAPVFNSVEIWGAAGNGTGCANGGECVSLQCVEGVCCNSACTGLCQSCRASLQGGGADGTCGPVAADTDPQGDCDPDPQSSCGKDGTCNGAGGCKLWGTTAACGSTCSAATQTTLLCNGAGACVNPGPTKPCTNPAQCADAVQCSTTCQTKNDCAATYYCLGGMCTAQKSKGQACTTDDECDLGHCADHVCCNAACSGKCEACTTSLKGYGLDGDCEAVTDGTDPDGDCNADPANSCGETGVCLAGQCEITKVDTPCGVPACINQGKAASSRCNGDGTCLPIIGGEPCEGFICDPEAGQCLTSCAASDDCAAGNYCDAPFCVTGKGPGEPCALDEQCLSGACIDERCLAGAACDGDHTIILPSGEEEDCTPYRCSLDGKCRASCESTVDCADGNTCSAEKKCEPSKKPGNADPGCGCRAVGSDASSAAWFFAAFAALSAAHRRARRGSLRNSVPARFAP